MGICESSHEKKSINDMPNPEKKKNNEDENSNNKETHHSSSSQQYNNNSKEEINNGKECPHLAKYERSFNNGGKKSEYSQYNKAQSVFSSGLTEEEVIIRGEINKNCKNKEEDFDNNSFKKLVKNNGGIIINNKDNKSNIGNFKNNNLILDFGNEIISEIKSSHPLHVNKGNIFKSLRGSGVSHNLRKNVMSENNNNTINPNMQINKNHNSLRDSYKINVSMQDNYVYLSVPRVDEPLPDIDEISTESPLIL
jgi:hypothetical protein